MSICDMNNYTIIILLAFLLLPGMARAFQSPQSVNISAATGLPMAMHHGLVVSFSPIDDPNLSSFKVEVKPQGASAWRLFSNKIRPYDTRRILLPYRTENYSLATEKKYSIRLCAVYGASENCTDVNNVIMSRLLAANAWEGRDSDDDILTSINEYNLGTDPRNPDSDNDQLADGFEVGRGLDPNLSQVPNLVVSATSVNMGQGNAYGNLKEQHATISISNSGQRVLRIFNGVFSGADTAQFKYKNEVLELAQLAPNQTKDIVIDFLPTKPGPSYATLDILSDDKAHFPVSINVSGTGKNIANLKVEANEKLTFSDTQVGGDSESKFVTISNPESDANLSVSVFLSDTLNFLTIPNRFVLKPGESKAVKVVFVPEWAGTYEGLMQIRSANSAGNNHVVIPLTARALGQGPAIQVQPMAISFGNIKVGEEAKRQVVVINNSRGLLYLKKIDFGTDGNGSAKDLSVSSRNIVVPPNGSNRIEVRFKPTRAGTVTSNLCMVTNQGSAGKVATACEAPRPIGQGLYFPKASNSINVTGTGI